YRMSYGELARACCSTGVSCGVWLMGPVWNVTRQSGGRLRVNYVASASSAPPLVRRYRARASGGPCLRTAPTVVPVLVLAAMSVLSSTPFADKGVAVRRDGKLRDAETARCRDADAAAFSRLHVARRAVVHRGRRAVPRHARPGR